MSAAAYEIRVVGALGTVTSAAFADVGIDLEPASTVLSANLDQAQLHDLLDRVRDLGLELIDVRRAG